MHQDQTILDLPATSGVSWRRFSTLGPASKVTAIVSGRGGGVSFGGWSSLNLGFSVGDDPGNVTENRRRFFREAGVLGDNVATCRQVHGARIIRVDRGGVHGDDEGADGLVTNRPGVVLFLTFADCVPVLVVDPIHQAVGLAHAGWKGTLAGIAGRLIETMTRCYGSRPTDVCVAIGPSIGPCCYVVNTELAEQFARLWPNVATESSAGAKLDLWETNRQQLQKAGIAADQIAEPPACTSCSVDTYFSHRAQRGAAGRFAVLLGWTAQSKDSV